MSQTLLKAVIFDFDGTVVDSIKFMFDVYNQIAKKYKLSVITPELEVELKHKHIKAWFDMFEDGISKQPLLLRDGAKIFYKKMKSEIQPIKGIQQVLQNLKHQGVKLWLLTSNKKNIVETLLDEFNLNLFDIIDTGSDLLEKANRITKRRTEAGYANHQVCYVGDEIRDIIACREAGISIIAVNWGYNSEQALQGYRPDGLARTPDDLWCMLKQRLKGVEGLTNHR